MKQRRVGKGALRAPCPPRLGWVGTLRFAHPTRVPATSSYPCEMEEVR